MHMSHSNYPAFSNLISQPFASHVHSQPMLAIGLTSLVSYRHVHVHDTTIILLLTAHTYNHVHGALLVRVHTPIRIQYRYCYRILFNPQTAAAWFYLTSSLVLMIGNILIPLGTLANIQLLTDSPPQTIHQSRISAGIIAAWWQS